MEIIQQDWTAFIKYGQIPGREVFEDKGKITLYENTDACSTDFPQRDIIESLEDTGIFSKLSKNFMKGRDDKFIA